MFKQERFVIHKCAMFHAMVWDIKQVEANSLDLKHACGHMFECILETEWMNGLK